jgi:hypothetical protein
MNKKQKIEEYSSKLQKYCDRKSFVKIYRTVLGQEQNISGFILGLSKHFVFLQLDSEFRLDGFAIIKLNDIDSIRHSSYERTQQKIFKNEGILDSGFGFNKPLPLTSWTEILEALKKQDFHIIIESINKSNLDFWIGEIKKVTEKKVSIHNYNPDGELDDKPEKIKLEAISILKFGDNYSTTLRKYLK